MNFVFVGGKTFTEGERYKFETNFKSIDNTFAVKHNEIESEVSIGKKSDFNLCTVNQSKNVLISIIDGLKQTHFDHSTLKVAIDYIRKYNRDYVRPTNSISYVDSGGYSIIVGDVSPINIPRFIYYYNYYLETEVDIYDYIFSLDIPIFLGHPKYNTMKDIEAFNRQSLTESIKKLQENPILQSKWYFIYQFKVKGQYEIWNKLFKELEIGKLTANYAAGGLVGMRGILRKDPNSTDINFSPFTAIAYKSLFDYLNGGKVGDEFRFHTLGIYIKYDRFQLYLLEKLFQDYLQMEGLQAKVTITYDSVNYMRTAQLKVRDLIIYQFTGDDDEPLIIHSQIQTTPKEIFEQVYGDKLVDIGEELSLLMELKNLTNIDSFTPMNVYSNVQLDNFFNYIIDRYEIDRLFFTCQNWTQFSRQTTPILHTIQAKWPLIFTPKLIRCIKENLRLTYIFHTCWMKERNEIQLDLLVNAFIDKIGFPGKLT
jgi:hypothetical protein